MNRSPGYAVTVVATVVFAACSGGTPRSSVLTVTTDSMQPTIAPGARVLLDREGTGGVGVRRGDIVVLEVDGGESDRVARVVALPGETVEARDGIVLVDGQLLAEPYLAPGTLTPGFAARRLDRRSYLVLGDRRGGGAGEVVRGSDLVGKVLVGTEAAPLPAASIPR